MQGPTAFFPVSVDEFIDHPIDLNAVCVQHPTATFFMRASGDAMRSAGIFDGDILVIDRSLDPLPGAVVIAIFGGDFVVKRLSKKIDGRLFLISEHPLSRPIIVSNDVEIWGVVTFVVHRP